MWPCPSDFEGEACPPEPLGDPFEDLANCVMLCQPRVMSDMFDGKDSRFARRGMAP